MAVVVDMGVPPGTPGHRRSETPHIVTDDTFATNVRSFDIAVKGHRRGWVRDLSTGRRDQSTGDKVVSYPLVGDHMATNE